jgi:hypothetical protein
MKTNHRPFQKWLLIATTFLISCNIFSQTKIPATWQPGMKLSMSYGGGMRYYSYKLEIKDSGSFYSVNEEGKVTNYKLNITTKDLNSLLTFLQNNRFDRIETEMKGPIYDKGSENILLSWNGHHIGAGENHMEVIADKYRDDYHEIESYIMQLVERSKQEVKELPGQESTD